MQEQATETLDLDLLLGTGFSYQLGTDYYTIEPPTLGTLLAIAREGQQLPSIALEADTPEGEVLARSWHIVAEAAPTMARIVAIATLGLAPTGANESQVQALTDKALQHLRARDLYHIIQNLYLSCNLADFINATRLVEAHLEIGGRVASKG